MQTEAIKKTVKDAVRILEIKNVDAKSTQEGSAVRLLKSGGYSQEEAKAIVEKYGAYEVIHSIVFRGIRRNSQKEKEEKIAAANNKQLTTPRTYAQALNMGFKDTGSWELGARTGSFSYVHPCYKGSLIIPFKLGRPYRALEERKS
jgi:fructose-bisphosphate aldolase class 1